MFILKSFCCIILSQWIYWTQFTSNTISFLKQVYKWACAQLRSYTRYSTITAINFRFQQEVLQRNSNYHFFYFICLYVVFLIIGWTYTFKSECFKWYILVFIKFLIQYFDTFDTFYNIFCTHIIFSLFDILRVDMYFN